MIETDKSLRAAMEQLPTAQLDELLQAELKQESLDDNRVRLILGVIRERETDYPVEITEDVAAAWKKYQQNIAASEEVNARKTVKRKKWYISIAAAAAVVCIVIMAVPRTVDAESIFDVLFRLTDSIVQFFAPDDDPGDMQREYVFDTDNPDLQQLYDQMVELGVTEPVVPMWIPEGYQLEEVKVTLLQTGNWVYAYFSKEKSILSLTYRISPAISTKQYEKQDKSIELYEIDGVCYTIIENDGNWSAMWIIDGMEGLIVTDSGKEDLYQIIKSIYRRG